MYHQVFYIEIAFLCRESDKSEACDIRSIGWGRSYVWHGFWTSGKLFFYHNSKLMQIGISK